MKVKVSEASGAVLDWMVAKCENYLEKIRLTKYKHFEDLERTQVYDDDYTYWNPSEDWSQGGPILSREHISRTIDHSGLWIAYWTDGYTDGDEGKKWMQCDRSELVAGLRCYVASKLGEEVEVPDELTH